VKRFVCWLKGHRFMFLREPCARCGKTWESMFYPNRRTLGLRRARGGNEDANPRGYGAGP
jgi:hypothetical protein